VPQKPLAVVPDLETELDALYALPVDEFTAARNDLARRLKQAGQADASSDVKQLRKPTVPVWAVNQLARSNADEVREFLQRSDELREAQREALGAGEPANLRNATGAQRDALQALTQRAHDLLEAQGTSASAAALERVAATLRAAALDPANRALLERGRLSEELDPSGFDAFAGMPLPKTRGKRDDSTPDKPTPAELRARRERVRELRAQAKEADKAARAAGQEAERAAAAAEKARAEAERAKAELEDAESTAV
jgi:hypothetical protein